MARFADPTAPLPAGVRASDVETIRRALACGPLRDLARAVTGPMSASRFLRNIRMSVRLRNFRFPPDPRRAERQACGG